MKELKQNGRAMTRLFNASTRGYQRAMKTTSNKKVTLDGEYKNILGHIKGYNEELKKYKIKVLNKDLLVNGINTTDEVLLESTTDIYVNPEDIVPNQRVGLDTHRVQHVIVEVDTLYKDLDFTTFIHISDFKIFRGVNRSSWPAAMRLWVRTKRSSNHNTFDHTVRPVQTIGNN